VKDEEAECDVLVAGLTCRMSGAIGTSGARATMLTQFSPVHVADPTAHVVQPTVGGQFAWMEQMPGNEIELPRRLQLPFSRAARMWFEEWSPEQ